MALFGFTAHGGGLRFRGASWLAIQSRVRGNHGGYSSVHPLRGGLKAIAWTDVIQGVFMFLLLALSLILLSFYFGGFITANKPSLYMGLLYFVSSRPQFLELGESADPLSRTSRMDILLCSPLGISDAVNVYVEEKNGGPTLNVFRKKNQ